MFIGSIINSKTSFATVVESTLHDGLVSLWEMNDTSGTTCRDLVGQNHGNNVDATIGHPGLFNTCYYFGGGDYGIEIPGDDSMNLTSATYTFWMRADFKFNDIADFTFFDKGVGGTNYSPLIKIDGGNSDKLQIAFRALGGVVTSTYSNKTDWPSDVWMHLTVVLTPGRMKFYFNAELDTDVPSTTMSNEGSQPLRLGARQSGAVSKYQGYMQQAGMWNRELSIVEIEELYNGGIGKPYSDWNSPVVPEPLPYNNIIGRWKLTGDALDYSTNSNDGVVNGVTFEDSGIEQGITARFNGVGQEITVADNPDLIFTNNQPFSLSCLIKFDNLDHNLFWNIISSTTSREFDFRLETAQFLLNTYTDTSTNRLSARVADIDAVTDQWYQITSTFDGVNELKLYVNGIYAYTVNVTIGIFDGLRDKGIPMRFGRYYGGLELTGWMKEAIIWNTKLTPGEILNLGIRQLNGEEI